MNYVVVMPSIRQPNLDYLEPLGDTPVFIIDDSDGGISKRQPKHVQVFDYGDRERIMGEHVWLIPQKNPSCKNLGLYLAWKEGFDVVVLLDDDCDTRIEPDFLGKVPVGKDVEAQRAESRSGWINTLSLLKEPSMWARGFPYEHRDDAPRFSGTYRVSPHFNEGLWSGTPDINGMDKFVTEGVTKERALLVERVFLLPGQKLPLSIMNVQIHRDLIPAFYQPPDYSMPGGFKIRRHDDVWAMYVLKKLMDLKGHVATVGAPLVYHAKEGDPLKEAISEHVTNLLQPYLTGIVDAAAELLPGGGTYAECARSLGRNIQDLAGRAPGRFRVVVEDYGKRVAAWASLFA